MKAIQATTITVLMLCASVAFSQQYNNDVLDSLISCKAKAQVTGNSKFVLTGYTAAGFQFREGETTFRDVSFNPIFLWKPAERIFVEAELETELEGEATNIALEYADVSFFVNRYMTLRVGKFLSPFGIYQDRLHPAWINKLPTAPLGYGHDGVGPSADIGVDLRGGVPLGSAKLNYSLYVSNGPQLNDGEEEPGEEGQLIYENADDNNDNKAVGGRIGLLPFANSALEIGGSFQIGKVGTRDSEFENVAARQFALDLTFVQQLDFLRGMLDLKAQWNQVSVDDADYRDPDAPGGTYTYDNLRSSTFAQVAYRPTMLPQKQLKRFELVFRYSNLTPPDGSKEPEELTQYTYGLNYWLNWRTAFKLAVQRQGDANAVLLQAAVGF